MKMRKIVPFITACALPMCAISFASCSCHNELLNSLSWDFFNQHDYTSTIQPKSGHPTYTIDEGISHYLSDIKQKPMILLDDIMLHETLVYNTLKESYTVKGYKDTLNFINVNVEKRTMSFSYVQEIELEQKENPYYNLGKTTISFKYLNIPYTSRFTFEASDLIAIPRWEFVPEFIKYGTNKTDLIAYFKSIENWSLEGTITTESSNETISFEFNRDNIASITPIQLSHLINNVFYNLWSNYYTDVGVTPDFNAHYNAGSASMICDADRPLQYPYSYVLHIDMKQFEDKSKILEGWRLIANATDSKHNPDTKSLMYDCVASINGRYFKQNGVSGTSSDSLIDIGPEDVIDFIIKPNRDTGIGEQDIVHFEFIPSWRE